MAVDTEMAQLTGSRPIMRVRITTSGATTDITSYLTSGAYLDMEKSRLPDQKAIISAGDVTLVFSNYDDKFTEEDASSIFNGVTYLGYNLDIDLGFRKDDGTTEYVDQAILKVIDVYLSQDKSECYIMARDILHQLVNFTLNVPANALVPVANAANTGNGYMTEVQTKPFATVNENWTLTCTTLGGAAVGIFDIVGSVSGDVGDATSDTEFSNAATGGIKFTIYAGGTDWAVGDIFTFTTRQYPEFTSMSPAKIIWNLLTGFDYDGNAEDDWSTATPKLDDTQGAGNTDINYASFQTAVTNLGTGFNLTGYINYNKNMSTTLKDILLHFLGYIYADEDGKIAIKTYRPFFGITTLPNFSDSKKISYFKYDRNYDNIVNSCTAKYKKTATWAWSGNSESYDGIYTKKNTTSITSYGERTYDFDTTWLSVNDTAIQWAVDRIIDKYGTPILDLEFITGLDALQVDLADPITITDTKTQITTRIMEINKLTKDFANRPMHINISCDDSGTTGIQWCFLGSSADESDGISPQAADYDSATFSDKQFCYLSQTGGGGGEYFLF